MRAPRCFAPGKTWSVTVRCSDRRYRLLPKIERKELLGFWLGRAQRRHPGVRIYCLTQMSNHIHLELTDQDGQLSDFMGYFTGNLARDLNTLDNVQGQVFERFRAIEILDTPALEKKLVYSRCNPIAANLVRTHERWLGLMLMPTIGSRTFVFSRFRSSKTKAVQGGKRTSQESKLTLSAAPGVDYSEVLRAIRDFECQHKQRKVVGRLRALKLSVHHRPPPKPKKPMPPCHCTDPEARRNYIQMKKEWIRQYREASAAFRSGKLDAVFPEFSYRPSMSVH